MAVAPDAVRLIESEADLDAVVGPDGGDAPPVALLAQTTLSHDEWAGLMESARRRFPDLWMPGRSDLCFATTNRQEALKALAGKVDAVVVIGSANSSNTVALEKVALAWGCPRVVRVNGVADLPDDLAGTVGVTAGASAPESLVQAVVDALAPADGVDVLPVTTEDEYFPPPPELRELLRALSTAVGLLTGAAPPASAADAGGADPVAGDRDVRGGRRPRRPGRLSTERNERPMTFTRMDESTAEQWHDIFVETIDAQPQVADHVLAMLRSLADMTFGFAVDQLDPLSPDGHPGRGGRRRRRDGGRRALSRHRQGGLRAEPSAHRGRDPPFVRPRRRQPRDRDAPGLPGSPLLRAPRDGPGPAAEPPGRTVVRPGGDVRRRLGPGELRSGLPDRSRSSTSSRPSARSSTTPTASDGERLRRSTEPPARPPAPRRRPRSKGFRRSLPRPLAGAGRRPRLRLRGGRQPRRRAQADPVRGLRAPGDAGRRRRRRGRRHRPGGDRRRCGDVRLPRQPRPRRRAARRLRPLRRRGRPLRRHARRRRAERPGRDRDDAPPARRRRGRLRRRVPPARRRRDDRPVPADRRRLLLLADEPADRCAS